MTDVCEHGGLRRACRICELEAEVEALRADAERYRWLRDTSTLTWNSLRNKWLMTAEQVDQRIDDEREQ